MKILRGAISNKTNAVLPTLPFLEQKKQESGR